MKKAILLIVPLIVIGYFLSVFILFRFGFGKNCTCYGIEIDYKCVGVRTMCFGLAPDMSLKDFKQDNKVKVLEINFNGNVLKTGDTFNFNPAERCLGDLKARLSYIYDNAISLEILEEQGLNGNYYETKPPKTVTIKDGVCVFANPLCMDVVYKYCFSLDSKVKPNVYSYEIKGESTMPLPYSQ